MAVESTRVVLWTCYKSIRDATPAESLVHPSVVLLITVALRGSHLVSTKRNIENKTTRSFLR